MASHLLALITPRRSPTGGEANLTVDAEQQRSSIRGTITRIGMLLNPPHHNSLNTSNSLHTPIPIRRSVTVNESAASADAYSPVRTRKNRAASFVQSAFGPSPRHGVKSKQRRVDDSDGDYVECDADDTIMEQWRLFLSDGFVSPRLNFYIWTLDHFSCFPYPQTRATKIAT
jgi:hypothetical protein